MLTECAIGDAYAAGFEYADPDASRVNDLSGYVRHPRHGLEPGQYTDDTQMSLAIAEAIVSGGDWTKESLAARFVDVFKRDPRSGYARGFYAFLSGVTDGSDFLARILPDSDKSGAAMRAAPVGMYRDVATVLERTAIQAAITNNTPDGIRAAQAAALLTHYLVYDLGDKADVGRFIAGLVPGDWDKPWSGKVGQKGWMSTRAAITVVKVCDSMSQMLQMSVEFRGDVDTVAAIALSAASASRQVRQDLPQSLYAALEDGRYGRRYIESLDRKLAACKGGIP